LNRNCGAWVVVSQMERQKRAKISDNIFKVRAKGRIDYDMKK
jgi:hypothetical protein